MTREKVIPHKIALLATGDEICNGDIFNSNSQEIAARLSKLGMNVRTHMAVPDTINELEASMRFLLKTHDALITTGGLGPTSDDLTRIALSNAIAKPLQFDEKTWEEICLRLRRFGYTTPPESNRQQAYFPAGAEIIPNPNGTAAGCLIKLENHLIAMLPGPPNECLPMLENHVLSELINTGFQHAAYHDNWLLFGVSEGKIAEELDSIANTYDCVTGYRLFYPYIEFKLHSTDANGYRELQPKIMAAIKNYLIGDGKETASVLLQALIAEAKTVLDICDNATGGALEAQIKNPQTQPFLNFHSDPQSFKGANIQIEIHGLNEYWQAKPDSNQTHLEIIFTAKSQHKKVDVEIPFRGKGVIRYAVEFICGQIFAFLQMQQADRNFHHD